MEGATALYERFTCFSCHLSSYITPTSKGNPRKELCVCHTPGSSAVGIAIVCVDKHTWAFFRTRTRQCTVTLKDTTSTWLFVPFYSQDSRLPRATLEVLLGEYVCIFPSPLSQLSDVLAHLLPSPSRYITDVPTRQKHPTATPCLPENLVELFNHYPSFTFKTPYSHRLPISTLLLIPYLEEAFPVLLGPTSCYTDNLHLLFSVPLFIPTHTVPYLSR